MMTMTPDENHELVLALVTGFLRESRGLYVDIATVAANVKLPRWAFPREEEES
jgi:hypothetical protein